MSLRAVRTELKRQVQANKNSLPHYQAFESHRLRQTQLLLKNGPAASLCVLGAGNCFDLDLAALCATFERLHLVDLDDDAVKRARLRLRPPQREQIVLHAPVDASGCNGELASWRDMKVTPEHLMSVPGRVSSELCERLGGPFGVVISACLLSQILLTARRILGDRHPLFDAANLVLTLAHLRTLLQLTARSGSAWLVTDVSSNEIAPLGEAKGGENLLPFMQRLHRENKLFNTVSPPMLSSIAAEDPVLAQRASLSQPVDAWLWRNGPTRTFLVYGSELRHRAPTT